MSLISTKPTLLLPECGACGAYLTELGTQTELHAAGTYAVYTVRSFDPSHCPHCGAEFVRVDIDPEARTCVALSKNEVNKMRIMRRKYVIITADRPTLFLTESGELSEKFDDAQLFDTMDDVECWKRCTDEPGKYTYLPVAITVEV